MTYILSTCIGDTYQAALQYGDYLVPLAVVLFSVYC